MTFLCACLPAFLPACKLPFLRVCPSYFRACQLLSACLSEWLSAFMLGFLPACQAAWMRACLPAYPSCMSVCMPSCSNPCPNGSCLPCKLLYKLWRFCLLLMLTFLPGARSLDTWLCSRSPGRRWAGGSPTHGTRCSHAHHSTCTCQYKDRMQYRMQSKNACL